MPNPLDLWLIAALGFLGSFGHCVGMCGPITAAFALSAQLSASENPAKKESAWPSNLRFHLLLNLGRLLSYVLVGAGIGALGSVVFAGGQMAGVGSGLRRIVSIFTGTLLIWFGLTQVNPRFFPNLPLLHSAKQQQIHEKLSQLMMRVSASKRTQTEAMLPLLLGLLWGLIPCGFLYAGQLRAAETQSWLGGAAVMLAFGAGTLPAMVAMGTVTALLSSDHRSQLSRVGGYLTIVIGVLLLVRTGDTMSDYSGHAALICLVLALIARPVSRFWTAPLRYRRVLGVGAFALSLLHVVHMASHTWNWNLQAVQFMLPAHQVGVVLGAIAILLMLPAALTSFDLAQKALGNRWRRLHLLGVPALGLAAIHTLLIGSSYWGALDLSWQHQARAAGLVATVGIVFGLRSPQLWSFFSLKKYYAPPKSSLNSAPGNPLESSPSLSPSESERDRCCRPD